MRILIVEDEKALADGLEAILKKESYTVDTVYNGTDGLDYMLSDIYDLVLLDIMLPGMDGITVLKKARKEGIRVPVILLTAKSLVEDKVKGLDSGADDYLTKPFDAEELLARIRVRTRPPGEEVSSEIAFGDIRLDRDDLSLNTDGRSVTLGNKEFQLMECLMMNGGRILDKETLISKVWGPLDAAEYNNLEVYVSFLRKKLRFIGAKARIQTARNIGYALLEE